VTVVDAAPMLGDDAGGLLTLVPVFAVVLWLTSGRRLRVRTLIGAGAAAVAVLVAATAADLARPPSARTHLGRFASDLLRGGGSAGTAGDLVARRWAANLHTYVDPGQVGIVAIAVGLLVGLAMRRWRWLLPLGSPERAVVGGALAVGLLGNVLNDSGSVVTALPFAAIGPFLVLLGIDRFRAGAAGATVEGTEPTEPFPDPPRPPPPTAPSTGSSPERRRSEARG
jgi:hypothetical protein